MNKLKILASGAILSTVLVLTAFGQGNDNTTGVAGQFEGNITTGCSYDPYTGNATRSITDIVVAGAVGKYGLSYSRTWNSRLGTWVGSFSYGIGEVYKTQQSAMWWPVTFPDGRQITFTQSTGAWTPGYAPEGPSGVREQIEGTGDVILVDGGKVHFAATETTDVEEGVTYYDWTFKLASITDPFGQQLTRTVNSDGSDTWTEPGGRWLRIYYRSDSQVDHVTASDGRTVSYTYTAKTFSPGTTSYNVLTSVSYYGDSSLTANYTWQGPNVGSANGAPLLKTASEPLFSGPMKQISYTYATGTNPNGTAAVWGQIKSENNYTTGQAVTTLSMNGSDTYTRTETRGDGKTRTLHFAAGGWVTSFTDFNGVTQSQAYDSRGYLSAITDRNNHTSNFTNNGLNGVIAQIQYPATPEDVPANTPRGTLNYVYGSTNCPDANNRDGTNPYYLYSTSDEAGNVTVFLRDANKRITTINYPDGGQETFTYNSFGQILTHGLRTGGTESSTYDARGLQQTYRNPSNASGNPTGRYTYDSLDRVASDTDALGSSTSDLKHTTSFAYNTRNQVTTTTLPKDPNDGTRHTIVNGYNPNGDGTLTSVTDQLSNVTSYTFDDYRRMLTKTTPQRSTGDNTPRTTNFYYDANGIGNDYTHTDSNITHITAPAGDKTVTLYDKNNRKTSVTVASGTADSATTSYGYDNVGNLTSVVSPNEQPGEQFAGKSTAIAYDARNRLMQTTDVLGHATGCIYDAGGRKLSVTRSNGQVTTFDSYDSMNRLLQQTVNQTPNPNAVTKYTYYTSGLLQTMQDPLLVENASADAYSYSYDTTGRKIGLSYPRPTASATPTSEAWHYDAAGRNDTFTNRNGKVETMTYDALNRLTGTSWNDTGLTPQVTYTYDAASRPVAIVNSNATISRTYFNDNLLDTETTTYADATPRTVTYGYDADANRATIQYPNGVYGFTYSYTTRNQLKTVSNTSGGANVITYGYDLDGNLSTRTPANGTNSTYTYDGLDRVTHIAHAFADDSRSFDYAYDSVSNRSWTKRDGANGDVFGYDLNDQSTSVLLDVASPDTTSPGPQTIVYDANGNRTTFSAYGPTDTYMTNSLNQYSSRNSSNAQYDANGNTTTGLDGSGYTYDSQNRLLVATNGASSEVFSYDGLNRQVSRTTVAGSIYNVYDGWRLIGEYQAAASSPTTAYVFGADGPASVVTSLGTFYYMSDASGSTSHLSDASGALQEWYRYDLHGTPIVYDASNTLRANGSVYGIRHLFTGQQWYADVRLYDLRNRFYSPDSGRFLQTDPVRFSGDTSNLYRYCGNNPLKYTDGSGEFANLIIGGAIGFAVDLTAQLVRNGGNFSQVNGWELLIMTGAGAATSGASAFITETVASTAVRVVAIAAVNSTVNVAATIDSNAANGLPLLTNVPTTAVFSTISGGMTGFLPGAAQLDAEWDQASALGQGLTYSNALTMSPYADPEAWITSLSLVAGNIPAITDLRRPDQPPFSSVSISLPVFAGVNTGGGTGAFGAGLFSDSGWIGGGTVTYGDPSNGGGSVYYPPVPVKLQ